jgi:hypothetical protein
MLRRSKMCGGVAMRRIIAAADVAARSALPERYPDCAVGGAFLARTRRSRRRKVRSGQCFQMLTRRHWFLRGSGVSRVRQRPGKGSASGSFSQAPNKRGDRFARNTAVTGVSLSRVKRTEPSRVSRIDVAIAADPSPDLPAPVPPHAGDPARQRERPVAQADPMKHQPAWRVGLGERRELLSSAEVARR